MRRHLLVLRDRSMGLPGQDLSLRSAQSHSFTTPSPLMEASTLSSGEKATPEPGIVTVEHRHFVTAALVHQEAPFPAAQFALVRRTVDLFQQLPRTGQIMLLEAVFAFLMSAA